MKMNKKILIAAALVLLVAAGVIFIVLKNSCDISKIDTSSMILFYGSGCPHCEVVDEYIKTNNVGEKIQFVKKEAFYNKCNAKLMLSLQEKCALSSDLIGSVPFLWNGENSACFVGSQDIINFFKAKLGK
ncbi:MAG: hypothetical protein PHF44_03005 [Candidatus Pacebacteria bacterium]|nr:hypothetical protein [Candidatus Paceibacterota bacterium]